MVHIKDIAKECGVSSATVSKALNDMPDVGEATKERIRAVADSMGYFSNAVARSLKTGRTNNIGVLFEDNQGRGLSHEYFSTILESIKYHAGESGYDVTFINSRGGMTYLQHCRSRGVDGVIVACINFRDPQIKALVTSDIPTVTVDYDFGIKAAVMSDNEEGGRAIMRHALDLGHRNIGIILGDKTLVTDQRFKGMMDVCEEACVQIPRCNIKEAKFHDSALTYFATQELLRLPNRPTLILFPDDYSYMGGFNAIRDAGLRIPEDISTIGYDGIELSRIYSPRLVTYMQDTESIGRKAVRALLEQIQSPATFTHKAISVKGSVLDGGSVLDLN